jgi:hypothetical protein
MDCQWPLRHQPEPGRIRKPDIVKSGASILNSKVTVRVIAYKISL